MMTRLTIGACLLAAGSLMLSLQCSKQPTSDGGEPSITLRFVFDPAGAPHIGKVPERPSAPAQPLAKRTGQEKVDIVRAMVLDVSAYDSASQHFESEEYHKYVHARDSWPGDLKYWAEWRKLLGDFFRVVADQALSIEGDYAKGTVTGVVGLNYLCVGMIEGDSIRYWGEGEVMVREGEPARAAVQVWDVGPQLYWLEVRPYFAPLKNGLSQRFRCTAYYSDGREVDVTKHAVWSVQPGIAGSIDDTGLFLAGLQATGQEAVLAVFEGDTAMAQVTIALATLLAAEDFETYAVGAYPSAGGWEVLAPGVGGGVSRAYAFSGAQSFRQESSPGHPRRDLLPLRRADSLTIQVSVLLQEGGSGAVVGLFNRGAAGGGAFVDWIEFAEDGHIYAARKDQRTELQPYEPLTWYTVRVELVYPHGNVFVDGEQKASMFYLSGEQWDALVLAAQDFASGTSVQFYDDLRMTRP
ncbi:MAG: hypothetical protein QHJ34_02635 [bacterium]|jgi:hypothetical protein|nr:hypothetical protein [candidate division KSB1 bacterium]MDH7559115.1 hypothetical protein [bacterium]